MRMRERKGAAIRLQSFATGAFRVCIKLTCCLRANTVTLCRMSVRKIRGQSDPRVVEAVPVANVGQRWNRDQFATIKGDQRRIDHLLGSHDDLGRQILMAANARTVPEL